MAQEFFHYVLDIDETNDTSKINWSLMNNSSLNSYWDSVPHWLNRSDLAKSKIISTTQYEYASALGTSLIK